MEKTTSGEGIACSNYANCYIGCSCNTSNGWYSSCQGTDCKSVTDTRYTGVNAMSASNVGDVTSLTDGKSAQSTTGTTQVVSLNGGVSTMSSSGATTCYKKKTCEEGGYYSSVPTDQKCSSKSYNGYTCYTSCSYKTCSDYGYKSSQPSGQTCTAVTPRSGLTCYKDCKDDNAYEITVTVSGKGSVSSGGCNYSINLWSGEFDVKVGGKNLCSGSAYQDWNVTCTGKLAAKEGDTVSVSASHVEWYASSASGGSSCRVPGPVPGPTASGTSTLSIKDGKGSAFVTLK